MKVRRWGLDNYAALFLQQVDALLWFLVDANSIQEDSVKSMGSGVCFYLKPMKQNTGLNLGTNVTFYI